MKQLKDGSLSGDASKGNPYEGTDLAEGIQAGLDHESFNIDMPQVIHQGAFPKIIGAYSAEAKGIIKYLSRCLNKEETAVDLGCGTGISTLELALSQPNARIIGIDPVEGMLEIAKDKFGQLTKYDIRSAADPRIHSYLDKMKEQGSPHGTRVSFQVGKAENLTDLLGPESISAMTANQVMHWTDLPVAFQHIKNVLRDKAEFIWSSASHFVDDVPDGKHPAYPSKDFGFRYNDFMAAVMEEIKHEHMVGDFREISKPKYTSESIKEISTEHGLTTELVGSLLVYFDLQTILREHIPNFATNLVYQTMDPTEREQILDKLSTLTKEIDEKGRESIIKAQYIRPIVDRAIAKAAVKIDRLLDYHHKFDIIPIFMSKRK